MVLLIQENLYLQRTWLIVMVPKLWSKNMDTFTFESFRCYYFELFDVKHLFCKILTAMGQSI